MNVKLLPRKRIDSDIRGKDLIPICVCVYDTIKSLWISNVPLSKNKLI